MAGMPKRRALRAEKALRELQTAYEALLAERGPTALLEASPSIPEGGLHDGATEPHRESHPPRARDLEEQPHPVSTTGCD